MKILKAITAGAFLCILFFSTTTQFTACSRELAVDTVFVRDTLTMRDTILVDCNCYDLKDGLVAWYNFKGGNLNDSSGKNNNIAFNNATRTADRFGNANGAYSFDGNSSYMRVANSASLSPSEAITLSAIVKVGGFYQGTCKTNQIFAKQSGSDTETGFYSLRFSHDDCNAPIDVTKEWFHGAYGDNVALDASSVGSGTPYIKTGEWYHVVYTFEYGVSKIYVNGELRGIRMKNASFTPNTSDLFIGKSPAFQFPYQFNGVIDDIRIYERALCYGEVKQLYRSKE